MHQDIPAVIALPEATTPPEKIRWKYVDGAQQTAFVIDRRYVHVTKTCTCPGRYALSIVVSRHGRSEQLEISNLKMPVQRMVDYNAALTDVIRQLMPQMF